MKRCNCNDTDNVSRLLDTLFLYRVPIKKKKSKDKFFTKSNLSNKTPSIKDITSLIEEIVNEDEFVILPFDFEIFDYVIKNKVVDMEDIDYSDVFELECIVNKYPKVIEYIDRNELNEESLLSNDILASVEIMAQEATFNEFLEKVVFPKLNNKDIIKSISLDNSISDRQKYCIKSILKHRFGIE